MTVEYSEGIAVRADEVLLDELADRLAGGTRSQRIRAVQRMRHCGQSGARILGATLDTKDADVLVIALGALRSMGTTAAAQSEAVDGLSDHPNATIRCRTLLSLTKLKPENRSVYIRRVFELGADGSPAERRAIHRQLSTLGAAAVDAAESRLQSDPSPRAVSPLTCLARCFIQRTTSATAKPNWYSASSSCCDGLPRTKPKRFAAPRQPGWTGSPGCIGGIPVVG